jgi:transposase InsO family protein
MKTYTKAYTDGLNRWEGLKRYFELYNKERIHQSLDYGRPENNCYKRSGIKSEYLFFRLLKGLKSNSAF